MPEDLYERSHGYTTYLNSRGAAPAYSPPAPSGAAPRSYGTTQQAQASGGSVSGVAAAATGGAAAGALPTPDFSLMTDQQINDYITENYPSYAWVMFADPTVASILRDGVRNQWTPAMVDAKVKATDWWRTTSSTARAWDEQRTLDPATANIALQDKVALIRQMTQSAGITMTEGEMTYSADAAIRFGQSDLTLRNLIMSYAKGQAVKDPGRQMVGGSIRTQAEQLQQMAANYLLPMSDQQATSYAQDLWVGNRTMDTIQGDLAAMAGSSWGANNPGLADALGRGLTPRAYLDPQVQMIATTLQMSPDQINLLDPKWSQILNQDAGGGQKRIMSVPETGVFARQQHEFRYTDQANNDADQRLAGLLNTMGERKF